VFVNAYTRVLQRVYQLEGKNILVNSIYPGTKHSKIPQVNDAA
jgi:NAD(P)-dependent dehydrogenase (short-subunit alcohol dehydrogenase family)